VKKFILLFFVITVSTLLGDSKQSIMRDDIAFEVLWQSIHECKSDVYVVDNNISSDYLRKRGYIAEDKQHGYAVIQVDERLGGMQVSTIVVPTTWSIVAITVEAPVETVKHYFEKTKHIKLSKIKTRHFIRQLDGMKFEIFSHPKQPKKTIVQCDSEQQ